MNPTDTDKTTGTTAPPEGGERTTEASGTTAGATGPTEASKAATDGAGAENATEDKDADGNDHPDGFDDFDDDEDHESLEDEETPRGSSGLLSAAASVIAAGLGVVGLSGSWVGRIAAERQTLIGQIKTSQGTPAEQISAIYGDAWHTTALVNGGFAFLALLIGLAVLTRPAKPGWVRAFALAAAALGGIGLLVSLGMYFDLLLSLPSAGS
ncbi:hypothetical protein [Streptomyces sp. NPDC004726]